MIKIPYRIVFHDDRIEMDSDLAMQSGVCCEIGSSQQLSIRLQPHVVLSRPIFFLNHTQDPLSRPILNMILEDQAQMEAVLFHAHSAGGGLQQTFFLEQAAQLTYFTVSTFEPAQIQNQLTAICQATAQLKMKVLLRSLHQHHEQVEVRLVGQNAGVQIEGLQQSKQQSSLRYDLMIQHEAPLTHSSIHFKGIAEDQSHLFFRGLIHVHAGISGIQAEENTRNLLLSSQAQVEAHPELEIESDDVQCRHGATVGNLDEQALFYLQSRGLSRESARQVLIDAFAGTLLDPLHPLDALVLSELKYTLERQV